MYLSAERMAVANQTVQETFEQTSVAWQAIPHWDTGDPGQTRVRKDITYDPDSKADADGVEPPLPGGSLEIETKTVRFKMTLAQATAPTHDALLAAVIARTVHLARDVDRKVINELLKEPKPAPGDIQECENPADLLNALIDARAKAEKFGYRAPSCLLTDTVGLKALSQLDVESGFSFLEPLLDAASINSRYRVDKLEELGGKDKGNEKRDDENKQNEKPDDENKQNEKLDDENKQNEKLGDGDKGNEKLDDKDKGKKGKMLLLGRRQRIAHGGAAAAFPGEEPVDLAVSVLPSLEIVGETTEGYIELAVRIRFAPRIKDKYGVVGVVIS